MPVSTNHARAPEFEADEAELANTAERRLNVGCGDWPMMYWVNLDALETVPADIHMDAIAYLQTCEAGRYDEIYAGHFLEHLRPDAAAVFLAECFRALTPGGKLGVVVPDTYEICKRYVNKEIDAVEYPAGQWRDMSDLNTLCSLFLYSTAQESPHQWSYDIRTLAREMKAAGFVDLKEIDRYRDPRLGQPAFYQTGIDGWKPREG